MRIIEELDKNIKQLPTLIQVGINGIWEDTWNIPFHAGMPSQPQIDKYLKKGTDRIAFEVFFRTEDNYDLILGIRFHEKLSTNTPGDFLITAFRSIWSTKQPTLSALVASFSERLTGDPRKLFSIDPTGIELGIINWWKSLGSIEVWNNHQEKTLAKNKLDKQLHANPHLLQNNKNYTAMELNYNVIPHHWIGIQVSNKHGENWILNETRLIKLFSNLLSIGVK